MRLLVPTVWGEFLDTGYEPGQWRKTVKASTRPYSSQEYQGGQHIISGSACRHKGTLVPLFYLPNHIGFV